MATATKQRAGAALRVLAPVRAVPPTPRRGGRRQGGRGLVFALGVVAAGAAAIGIGVRLHSGRAPRPAEPTCARIAIVRGAITGTLPLPGRIGLREQVRVGSVAPGQVIEIKAAVGDRIARGQVLARLDDLEQRAAIVAAAGQVAAAEVATTRAERELLRIVDTLRRQQALPDLPADDQLADGPIGDAQLDLIAAAAQSAKQEAMLALARRLVDRRTIRAPISGVVVSRSIAAGETVEASPPGPPLFVLGSDPATLRVMAEVGEPHVGRVEPGPATVATRDGRRFAATVLGVNRLATTRTPAAYEVALDVRNPDGVLAAGMSATVSLAMTSAADALRVPVAAVETTPAGTRLRVAARDGRMIATPVTTGVGDGVSVEVDGAGLAAGQMVVANPAACLASPGGQP
jgi:RND family efflux transporter MFP subunit